MKRQSFPILEHPGDGPGVIEPSRLARKKPRLPPRCVLCFFLDVLTRYKQEHDLEMLTRLPGEGHPVEVYRLAAHTDAGHADAGHADAGHADAAQPQDGDVALCFPGIGAPFAAAVLEELIAMGGKGFICCGGAGVLDGAVAPSTMIVVADAVRDEGTSYHYQTEGRVSRPHPQAVRVLEETLTETGVSYLTARTWTTDAVYRETPGKVRARRAEGCLTVEMEAAALFAVAAFRKVICGQLLYGGDDVSGAQWDHRNWIRLHDTRARLLELAIGACRRLEV